MSKTFNRSREDIANLCRYISNNHNEFLKPGIKEAHIRQSLIDPLFEALGWDVRNTAMAAPQYREVIPEDSLEIEGSQKAPDYTFRIQTIPKFFTEAKKCGININADPGPAYQLRRYGWSARVPFSILTDFEELGVYDCSLKPRPVDKAGFGRTLYYRSEEYPDRWRELWDIFSKEAVLGGAYDKLAAAKRRRGTSEVDDEFLKEIEAWRDSLARNIAVRNQFLAPNDLNTVVQRTIDRIIFLRMAEDRGSEPYGQLLKLCDQPDIYKRFINKLCRKADEKYNSGLFHFSNEAGITEEPDLIATKIQVDDKVFKPILQNLYFENGSPYHFGVMPVEMLGTVYERFLGKVIRLTPEHRAKVEEKPEVRKVGGVYYTPAYIVDYIVKNTIGKMIEGKSPTQLAGGKNGQPIRVLDMACGSGSFLLGAFQCLLDHCLKWYIENQPEKLKSEVYRTSKGEWRLSIAEKKRILITHIFGVDIDSQAVEVSKLSLLLKVMEGETDESVGKSRMLFHQRALPNLSANIKCGNSLIASDFSMIPEDLIHVNAFDWSEQFPGAMRAGGFDFIIGNPPYIRIQTMQESSPESVSYLKGHYAAAGKGNYDIYVVFVERALSLLNSVGQLGYILPHKFFNAQYGEALRRLIANGKYLSHIVYFGDQQVFEGATTYTALMFLNKAGNEQIELVKVNDLASWRESIPLIPIQSILRQNEAAVPLNFSTTGTISATSVNAAEWNFSIGKGGALFERLNQMPVKLKDVAEKMFQGLVTSSDPVYLLEPLSEEESGFVTVKSKATNKEYRLEIGVTWPLCKGSRDIRRYFASPSKRVVFPYDVKASTETGKTVLITSEHFITRFPCAWKYLNENIDTLRNREKGKMRHDGWYGYVYPKSIALFAKQKILTPAIASAASFTLDTKGELYFVGSGGGGGGGYGVILKDDCALSYEYILGLLNSKVLDYFIKSISSPFQGGYYAYNRQYIEQLPIKSINFSTPTEKDAYDKMVGLVKKMLTLCPKLHNAKSESDKSALQNAVTTTNAEIDRLVYKLYDLTEEEIKMVEDGAAK